MSARWRSWAQRDLRLGQRCVLNLGQFRPFKKGRFPAGAGWDVLVGCRMIADNLTTCRLSSERLAPCRDFCRCRRPKMFAVAIGLEGRDGIGCRLSSITYRSTIAHRCCGRALDGMIWPNLTSLLYLLMPRAFVWIVFIIHRIDQIFITR